MSISPEKNGRGATPVAFVTTSLGIGGAERLLVELITRLDRRSFRPLLVCLKDRGVLGEQLAGAGIPVVDRLLKGRFDVRVVERLMSVFRRESVRLVCTVGTGGDRSFWGRLAAWWSGVPAIVSCPHSMGLPDRFEPPNRLLSGITDAFIAVAHTQKRYLVACEGFAASRIGVIHNGVDLQRFSPGAADPRLRAAHGISDTAPLVGLVACLRPEKDVATFLRAARFVGQRMPEARFVIVGEGPERTKLEALTRELDLAGRVIFAGMCSDVAAWLRTMDVVALTSICEAFPLCLLEAMACAKPVVATRVGAIPEMVRHNQTGLLVPSRDPEATGHAIVQILRDRAAARQIGIAARRYVEDRFGLDSMVHGYESLFRRLLARKCPNAEIADSSLVA